MKNIVNDAIAANSKQKIKKFLFEHINTGFANADFNIKNLYMRFL